ncbi:unnamed protein product [Blepharisma stoltei]|uniref:Uncharacterized protein n=1 Tax=Blepharisma stoltei TaxID=1481888 RepID=A0AAU9ISB5_9CILI|nr:unnamed protein product [Blepharisma stoltei]
MSILEDYEEIDFSVYDVSTDIATTQASPKAKKILSKPKIPLLNKDTTDSNTYDYERLLKQYKASSPTNFRKSPSPKSNEVVERLLFKHQLSQNRIKFQQQEQEYKEKEKCPFAPQVSPSRSVRCLKQFLQDQINYETNKQQKLEKQRFIHEQIKEAEEEKARKKINLSPGTQRILSKKGKMSPVHERLYSGSKMMWVTSEKKLETLTRKPIKRKSLKMESDNYSEENLAISQGKSFDSKRVLKKPPLSKPGLSNKCHLSKVSIK